MKLIVMGTGPFAVPTFRAVADRYEVPFLVTRPAVPNHKGKQPPKPDARNSRGAGHPGL